MGTQRVCQTSHPFCLGLLVALAGCNAILGLEGGVEILCEDGSQCPSGFCRSQGGARDNTCDDRQWVRSFGGEGDERVGAVAFYDPDDDGDEPGRVIVVGSFEETIDFGEGQVHESEGGRDAFVVALGPDGTTLWSSTYAGSGDQQATAVDVDDDGDVFIAGKLDGDADFSGETVAVLEGTEEGFVARLDGEDGKVKWVDKFGGTRDLEVSNLTVYETQPFILGTYSGAWESGPAGALESVRDAGFILTYRRNGTGGRAAGFGTTEDLSVCCGHVDPLTGELLVAGEYTGEFQTANNTLVSEGASDGYILFGLPDADGVLQFTSLGSTDLIDAIDTDSLGRVLFSNVGADGTAGSDAVIVVRYATIDNIQFVRADAPVGSAKTAGIVHNRANETLVFGHFSQGFDVAGGPNFDADDRQLFFIVADQSFSLPNGRTRAFVGEGDATASGIEIDAEGRSILTGDFRRSLQLENEFGAPVLESAGGRDAFVAQLEL